MKNIFLIYIILFFTVSCSGKEKYRYGERSENIFRYEGIDNSSEMDPDFSKGSELIKKSIMKNLNHLNLYEYAHALPELYELIYENKVSIDDWKKHIDSIELEVEKYMTDSVSAYWAVDYLGLIPLQVDFFLASLHASETLKNKYPEIFRKLNNNTSRMMGLGYKEDSFSDLIKFSDTKGETTFWFFFQLEGCNLIKLLKDKIPKDNWNFFVRDYLIVSTFKTSYYLQKRKWQSIQRRLANSGDTHCIELSILMNERTISINDIDIEYFSESLKEGVDRNKTKEF